MKLSRLLAAPAVAGAMLLAQAAGISPAQASTGDLACNYDFVTFNACLHFTNTGLNQWRAHVGLDQVMSQQYAQEIVNHGAAFRATLWGDDGGGKRQFLANMTVAPGWPAAGPDGLGAELIADLPASTLNEDTAGGDEDEIYAIVSYFDFHNGGTISHPTGTVHGQFAPVSEGGGGGGCLVVCP